MEQNKFDLTDIVGKTIHTVSWDTRVLPPKVFIQFTDGFSIMMELDGIAIPDVTPPEGYNGPGMYEAKLSNPIYEDQGDFIGYIFTFNGEEKSVPTGTFRFIADSLEHAKSMLNLEELEYVKWVSKWPQTRNDE